MNLNSMKEVTSKRKFFFEGEFFTRYRLDAGNTIWVHNEKVLDEEVSKKLENFYLEKGK